MKQSHLQANIKQKQQTKNSIYLFSLCMSEPRKEFVGRQFYVKVSTFSVINRSDTALCISKVFQL